MVETKSEIREFEIYIIGAAILRNRALGGYHGEEQTEVIEDLKSVCRVTGARGMAANQIGYYSRICLVTMNDGVKTILVDPVLSTPSELITREREYCFSLPGMSVLVDRPESIRINYKDEKGNEISGLLSGTEARIVQHEVDHLEGILMTDKNKFFGQNKIKRLISRHKRNGYKYWVNEIGEYRWS